MRATINLLTQWIGSELTNRQNFAAWQIAYFGSTDNPLAAANFDADNDGVNNYHEFLTMTSPTNNGVVWGIDIARTSTNAHVIFERLANPGFLVESSTNLFNWTTWNVPGNQIWFGSSNVSTVVSGPILPGVSNQFFRVRVSEP